MNSWLGLKENTRSDPMLAKFTGILARVDFQSGCSVVFSGLFKDSVAWDGIRRVLHQLGSCVGGFWIQKFTFVPSANFRELEMEHRLCSSKQRSVQAHVKTPKCEQIVDFMLRFCNFGLECLLKRIAKQQQESKNYKPKADTGQCQLGLPQPSSQDNEVGATTTKRKPSLPEFGTCTATTAVPTWNYHSPRAFLTPYSTYRLQHRRDRARRGYSPNPFDTEYSGAPNILHRLGEESSATQHHLPTSCYSGNAHVSGKFPAGRWGAAFHGSSSDMGTKAWRVARA